MRCLLLVLFCSFFARLESAKSDDERELRENSFFVSRTDTKEAICLRTPKNQRYIFPAFDLDKLQFPPNVGLVDWGWLTNWQLKNYTKDSRLGRKEWIVAGDRPFQLVKPNYIEHIGLYILASNISLWLAKSIPPQKSDGMLIEIDHWNQMTNVKETTLKYCDRNPEDKGANCTTVGYKNATNYLNDGNNWGVFLLHAEQDKTGVTMYVRRSNKELETVANWTLNEVNQLIDKKSTEVNLFVKTDKRNAALISSIYLDSGELHNNLEMTRKYSRRNNGTFCVQIEWKHLAPHQEDEILDVKNSVTGQLALGSFTRKSGSLLTTFNFDNLDAGEYEITARFNNSYYPLNIDMCPGANIWKSWRSIPKAVTKCQYTIGWEKEFTVGPSSAPDPKLKPDWSLDDWVYVCDRLGIGSKDTEVPIKFCNFYGCNTSKCPHLQDN